MTPSRDPHKLPFLSGVFLITFSLLIFQILQTRLFCHQRGDAGYDSGSRLGLSVTRAF